jgi:hypothetical protein
MTGDVEGVVDVLAPTANRASRGTAKMVSMASELEKLMEITIVVTASYSSPSVVLREIEIDMGLNPLQLKFKDLYQ